MADPAPPALGVALPPTSVLKIRDACLPCRKQRSKCDGQPCCSRCARLELECTYVELVKAPTPAKKEAWEEFLTITGAKPDALEVPPIDLLKDQTNPLQDTATFPWQKSKISRRRKPSASLKCTCPTSSTDEPAGQDSSDQWSSPQGHDGSSPDFSATASTADSTSGSSASPAGWPKRRGRSANGTCRLHNPQTSTKSSRSSTTGLASPTTPSNGTSSVSRHRPPQTNEPVQLPSSVIETSEKINSLSSKLSRLYVFPDTHHPQPPPPPQLEILRSRALSPLLQSHLIQLYLAQCLPTQPILDPPTFLAQLAAQDYCTPPHPLLIAAMCAAAARCLDDADVERFWDEQDPPLPNPMYPNFANGEPHVRSTRDMIWSIGEYFAALAKGYLRTELPLVQSPDRSGGMGDPLTVVQGLIMISTWDASVGRQRECQACAALALRIMIAGGWHLMDHPNGDGCTDSRIKMWGTLERELARRCWWFVWIAEKWTAAMLTQYVTLHLSLCETLSLPREFRQGDGNDQKTVLYFTQSIQSAYLVGAIIQLHYHPFEAEDGTDYDHEASVQDVQRLQARLLEIDHHLDAWYKALPAIFRPDWGQSSGDEGENTAKYEPVGNSQFFHAGGDWWWRHAMGGMLEMNYFALKLLLHQPQHVVSKTPSPLSRLTLAQYANRITLTCERLWQYPTTRPTFYHVSGALLWIALCYQQENTLNENPRIRTPACVNMQKSYYLVKKAGRLVHSNEDEPLTELESTNGASPSNVPIMRPTDEQRVKPMMDLFKEMFPIMRQALRDKGFGLRTQPTATSRISPNMLLQNSHAAVGNMTGSPVDSLVPAANAASVIGANAGAGPSSYYLAPLTPPGSSTSVASPMTESLGSAHSPSPPPCSLIPGSTTGGCAVPHADGSPMFATTPDIGVEQYQQQFQPRQDQVPLFHAHQTSPIGGLQYDGTQVPPILPNQHQLADHQHQQQQAFSVHQIPPLPSGYPQQQAPPLAQSLQPSPPLLQAQMIQHASMGNLTDPLNSLLNMSSDPFSSIVQNEPNLLSSLIDYSEWLNHSLE